MEKTLLLQGKILKLQQLFAKNWLQYGRPGYQSGVVAGRLSKSVVYIILQGDLSVKNKNICQEVAA